MIKSLVYVLCVCLAGVFSPVGASVRPTYVMPSEAHQEPALDAITCIQFDELCLDAMYYAGIQALDRKEYHVAIQLLTELIEIEPQAVTLNSRGVAYDRIGAYRSALRDFNAALGINPQMLGALRNRAVVLLHLGQYASALRDINEVLATEVPNPDLLRVRAAIYSALGETHHAHSDYDKAAFLEALERSVSRSVRWSIRGTIWP